MGHLLALAFPDAVPSNKEGRRKVTQGGVRIDGDVVEDPDLELTAAELDGKLPPARPPQLGPPPGVGQSSPASPGRR